MQNQLKSNAPMKIYLCPSELAGIDYDEEWYESPFDDNSIEYTRTDAFIEKACDWMDEHCKLLTSKDYEDFRNYIQK